MSLVRWCYIGIRFVEKSLQMYEMFLWRRRKMRWIFYVLGHRCEKPRKGGRRGVRLFPEKYGGIGGRVEGDPGRGAWGIGRKCLRYLQKVLEELGKSGGAFCGKRRGKKIPAPGRRERCGAGGGWAGRRGQRAAAQWRARMAQACSR